MIMIVILVVVLKSCVFQSLSIERKELSLSLWLQMTAVKIEESDEGKE